MDRQIPFLKFKRVALTLSVIVITILVAGTIKNSGFNMGIDFVGGTKITASFEQGVDEASIRNTLTDYSPTVQSIGSGEKNEYMISTRVTADDDTESGIIAEIREKLETEYDQVEFLSVESVGPAIGDYLRQSAVKLIIISVILMSLYLAFRFEIKYAVAAVVTLIHDLVIVISFCGFAGVEINIPAVAAMLTIFGYSVNDSIVIFDRIRENVDLETKTTLPEIVNRSINQSIVRSLVTSLTTLLAVLALYILGGEGINEFALVLLVGIIVGTYSSIYIAAPILLWWESLRKAKR